VENKSEDQTIVEEIVAMAVSEGPEVTQPVPEYPKSPTAFFCCLPCDLKFLTEGDLQKHLKEFHQAVQVECPFKVCPGSFPTAEECAQHVERAHKKTRVCPMCGTGFHWKADLRRHERKLHPPVDPAKRRFPCKKCRVFFPDELLAAHEKDCPAAPAVPPAKPRVIVVRPASKPLILSKRAKGDL